MENEKLFTLSILTENKSGLLNRITIIFTRRKINIEAINVSGTEVEGISRYTIVVKTTREKAEKLVRQIQKQLEVLGTFMYEDDEIYYQEIALYKVPTKSFMNGNTIERLVRDNGARILVIEDEHIVLEKTGHMHETTDLFQKLKPYGVLGFARSGRVALSKSKRKTSAFLEELEKLSAVPADK